MCTIQYYGYVINNNYISNGPCNAFITDKIQVSFGATFSASDIGKTVKGDTMLQSPPGTLLPRLTNPATQYINDTSTRDFFVDVNTQITKNGVYLINDVGLTDSSGTTLCFTGAALYGCQLLNITTPCVTPSCTMTIV